MLLKTSVGIEIAGQDLRIAVVRSFLNRLRLADSFSIPGFTELPDEEKKQVVETLARKQSIPASRVYLALPREKGIVRQLEFPAEVRDQLRSAVTLQVETLSPWPIEEVYWNFSQDSPKKGVKTSTVTVVVIPRFVLDPWIEFFKAVKLPLTGAALSSTSWAHGVAVLWGDTSPALVLGCEEGYVEGALIHNGRLASVTAEGTDVESQANTSVERLAALGRVTSPENARLIAHGRAAGAFGSGSSILLPLENAKPNSAQVFGAIAAALSGLKRSAFNSNVVPPGLRYRRSQLQLIPTYGLIVLIVFLAAAMWMSGVYQAVLYASKIDSEIQRISPQVREVAQQEAELNQLSEKYRVLSAHFRTRDANLEVLRELAAVLPSTTWLAGYTYQDGAITISGFSSSTSDLQRVLEDHPLFKDVQFASAVTRDGSGKDRFTIRASLEARP